MNNTFDDIFRKIYEKRSVFYYCDNCEKKEEHFGDAQNIAETLSQYGILPNGWGFREGKLLCSDCRKKNRGDIK